MCSANLQRGIRAFALPVVALILCGISARADKLSDYIALIEASRMGDADTIKRLSASAAEINRADGNGWTPLMHAADAGQSETARLLVERGAQVNAVGPEGETALENAIASGNNDIVRLLLSHGANPSLKSKSDDDPTPRHPLKAALFWDNSEAIEILERAGVSVEPFPDEGEDRSAFTIAATFGSRKCLTYLLKSGHSANVPDARGDLPLPLACQDGDLSIIRLLVDHGADVNGVSKGPPTTHNWGDFPLTPLAAATIGNRSETVRYLLDHGANPRALDNMAILFADMLGNETIYRMLREAGVPEPPPYGFTKLRDEYDPDWKDDLPVHRRSPARPWDIQEILSYRPVRKNEFAVMPACEIKVAVISEDSKQADSVSLVETALGKDSNVTVLERDDMGKILGERKLAGFSSEKIEDRLRVGKILGADCLIFLRNQGNGKDEVHEARIVSTETGVILDSILGGNAVEPHKWALQVEDVFKRAAVELTFDPRSSVLLSIPNLKSAVTTAEGLQLEKQVRLGLACLLAAQPGVHLLEREELDRIALEKNLGESHQTFLNSAWVLDGNLEISQASDVTLHLQLLQVTGKKTIPIEVTAPYQDPAGFLRKVVAAITANLPRRGDAAPSVSPEAEAEAYFEEAKWFAKSQMWERALAASEAAWGLGLRTNAVLEMRMHSIHERLTIAKYAVYKEKIEDMRGISQFMAYRAPLVFPATTDVELSAEEYLDLSQRMLSAFQTVLADARRDYSRNRQRLCFVTEVLKCGTCALAVLNSISARAEYAPQLQDLREQLKGLNCDVLALAREHQDADLVHVCFFNYFLNGAFWEKDESLFHRQVNAMVQEALDGKSLPETNAVFNSLIEVVKPFVNCISGCATTAWRRLAEDWQDSEDVRLSTLADCILGVDKGPLSARYRDARKHLFQTYLKLRDMNPGPVGRCSWAIDLDDSPEIYSGYPWPQTALALFSSLDDSEYSKALSRDGWAMPEFEPGQLSSGPRCLPEWRDFILRNLEWELENVRRNGSGSICYNDPAWQDCSAAQLSRLLDETKAATAALALMQSSDEHGELKHDLIKLEATLKDDYEKSQRGLARTKYTEPLSVEDYRIPVAERCPSFSRELAINDGIWIYGGHVWVLWRNAGLVELDAAGHLVSTLLFPEGVDATQHTSAQDPGDLDGRYFVTRIGRFGGKDTPETMLIYNWGTKRWKRMPLRSSEWESQPLKIMGDQIIYSFEQNPDRSNGYKAEKDTTHGVMLLDLQTGKEQLLVSSRRKPAQSPLDHPTDGAYSLRRISDSEILIKNKVYNIRSGQWREAPGSLEDKLYDAEEADRELVAAGRAWTDADVTYEGTALNLSSYHPAGSGADGHPVSISIPIRSKTIGVGWQSKSNAYNRPDANGHERSSLGVEITSLGLIFCDGVDLFFVPVEKLQSLIEHAMK
jgi:ankyrin repeat protein